MSVRSYSHHFHSQFAAPALVFRDVPEAEPQSFVHAETQDTGSPDGRSTYQGSLAVQRGRAFALGKCGNSEIRTFEILLLRSLHSHSDGSGRR